MTLSKSLSCQALGFLICQWGGQDPLVSILLMGLLCAALSQGDCPGAGSGCGWGEG